MRVQSQLKNTSKLSLSKIINNPAVPYHERPIPSLPNHISWSEEITNPVYWIHTDPVQSKPKPRRRKIFQNYSRAANTTQEQPTKRQKSPYSMPTQQRQLRKVKSNGQLFHQDQLGDDDVARRIREINRLLDQHRQSKYPARSAYTTDEERNKWTKIEEKLTESTRMIKKQEETLSTKIPTFQKTIEANNHAISQLSSIIKENKSNVDNLIGMMTKNESRLKVKEVQLCKINSQLLLKQSELIKNKQENKKRELELLRMRRIEDLQNSNLQLYQQLEKRNKFKQFQNVAMEETEDVIEGKCWEDDQPITSQFTHSQESTIRCEDHHLNLTANNTIGQILSPLTLNEQYQCN